MIDTPNINTPDKVEPTRGERLLKLATWVLESFGPLLAFWIALRIAGLLTAIWVSIIVGVALVVREIVRDRKISPFTAFIATSVAVFGVLDLHYQSGFFIKIEPALGNAATGVFFIGSVFWGRPVIIELAERSAGKTLPHARRYLTGWTVVWGVFFFVRAAAFVWMAFNLSLEKAILVRGFAGPISFAPLFAGEMLLRKVLFRKSAAQSAAK